MKYEVAFSKQAQRGLTFYLTQRFSSAGASTYNTRLLNECQSLGSAPFRGTLRPGLGNQIRTIGFDGRTTILFRIDQSLQRVIIIAVRHRGRIA